MTEEFVTHGISTKQNALPDDEHYKIINGITELEEFCTSCSPRGKQPEELSCRLLDFSSDIKFAPLEKSYYESNGLWRFYSLAKGEKAVNNYPTLFTYAQQCAEHFFKRNFNPNNFKLEFISEFSDSPELPSKLTRFHVDRFVPALKLLYSPKLITSEASPFEYVKGSHIIEDDQYYESIKAYDSRLPTYKNSQNLWRTLPMFENRKSTKIEMRPNSIHLVATNGLHRRSGFTHKTQAPRFRHMLFIDFYSFLKKTDILSFR